MAMKILLMVMLVTALGHGTAKNCKNRKDLRVINELSAKTRCTKPQEYPVQLPVPEGYDYVRPSVAKLKQCTGLSCKVFPEKCLPDLTSITTKAFRVNAYRVNDHTPHCEEVQVQEHGACDCRCEEIDCPPNKVYKEETCQCECDPSRELQCKQRRAKYGILSQWSQKTCSCKCIDEVECDSGMIWVQELCRCIRPDEEDPNYLDSQSYLDYLGYPN